MGKPRALAEWPGRDAVFDRRDGNHDRVVDAKDAAPYRAPAAAGIEGPEGTP